MPPSDLSILLIETKMSGISIFFMEWQAEELLQTAAQAFPQEQQILLLGHFKDPLGICGKNTTAMHPTLIASCRQQSPLAHRSDR